MGILQRRHLSTEGHVLASTLQQQLEAEADGLEMVANRLHHGVPHEVVEDPEYAELVRYLSKAARRLRILVEDL